MPFYQYSKQVFSKIMHQLTGELKLLQGVFDIFSEVG